MDEELWQRSGVGYRQGTAGPYDRNRRARARDYLGRKLREWRREQGLTQPEAHEQLGMGGRASRAADMEQGKIPWRAHEVEALAGALGTDVDELLREAIQASDPEATRRREETIAYALTLDSGSWDALVAEVERRRRR